MPTDVLTPEPRFASLSVRDLLEARDLYHNHLIHKANVVGTAIGRYLIPKAGVNPSDERRFDNSEIRGYSWPCVIVMVREWVAEQRFRAGKGYVHPRELVPETLFMPDGRTVPVCVVRVVSAEVGSERIPRWHWPDSLAGGGFPLLTETQRAERIASVGCLVSDGHTTYALTNRHVSGAPGEPIFSIIRGRRTEIGRASDKQLTRRPFSEVYPQYPGHHTYLTLDAGLIEVNDVNDWTSRIYGLGAVGELADLSEINISLRLIDQKVVAYGAASGELKGRIKALFYRYRSVGGYDYVSDFLIAPEDGAGEQTHPGDSGTIWHLSRDEESEAEDGEPTPVIARGKQPPVLQPLAIEWGGQTILGANADTRFNFSLATSLSNVCKLLDVEIVAEHNAGVRPFWGQTGHYSIAAFACGQVAAGKLRALMEANLNRVSFEFAALTPEDISTALKQAKTDGDFVPLADVPDVVWKKLPSQYEGGRDTQYTDKGRTTGPEHPTHYADIDEPRPGDKKTLRELCLQDPANVDVAVWQRFYDAAGHTESSKRGLLPFRVWQFFDAMVGAVQAGDVARYVCAAGLLAHYVGDACQPLHGSIYSDGYADRATKIVHRRRETGELYEEESHVGAGVHSTYETSMIDRFVDDLLNKIQRKLQQMPPNTTTITNGQDAATAIIGLMDRSATTIPPRELVAVYIAAGGKKIVKVMETLWKKFGDETSAVMADGAQVLGRIWEAAWTLADGGAIPAAKLGPVDKERLKELYSDPGFVPSLDLDHIGKVLK